MMYVYVYELYILGSSDSKVSAYNAGDLGSIPGSRKIPWSCIGPYVLVELTTVGVLIAKAGSWPSWLQGLPVCGECQPTSWWAQGLACQCRGSMESWGWCQSTGVFNIV